MSRLARVSVVLCLSACSGPVGIEPTAATQPPLTASEVASIKVAAAYRGILGREPDSVGLGVYRDLLLGGTPVVEVCRIFFGSDEFAGNRGNLSPEELASALYEGILQRDADAGGLTATAGEIRAGRRSERAAEMIDSEEFADNFLDGGSPPPPTDPPTTPPAGAPNALRANAAYLGILGRGPDDAGLAAWASFLDAGGGVLAMCNAFYGSAEYASHRAGLSPDRLATELYRGILKRDADAGGHTQTKNEIQAGRGAARAAAMIESPEFVERILGQTGPTDPPPTNGDDAAVIAHTLPAQMACRATASVSVTLRNGGQSTWTRDTFRLGAVGDEDPFYTASTRVLLPDGVSVPPGGQHTFFFALRAPSSAGPRTSDWQMVHEGVHWFGATASRSIDVTCTGTPPSSGGGALAVHPENPHYFVDTASGEPVLLAGWGSIVPSDRAYDYAAGIRELEQLGIPYARVWHLLPWSGDDAIWPWARSNVGGAYMGGNKYDFDTWDNEYWTRMRDSLRLAHDAGIQAEIHLFDRCGMSPPEQERWGNNPWASDNNINQLETPRGQSDGTPQFYGMNSKPNLFYQQQRYVQKMIDETIEYTNVIYEIENEHWEHDNTAWARYWADFVRGYIAQHHPGSARLIAYNSLEGDLEGMYSGGYLDVVNKHYGDESRDLHALNDYLESRWSRGKAINVDEFANGEEDPNVLRQMCWTIVASGAHFHIEDAHPMSQPAEVVRNVNRFVRESGWDFVHSQPDSGAARQKPGFCMVDPGKEYVCYFPAGGSVGIDLAAGNYRASFWDPRGGGFIDGGTQSGGGVRTLVTPDTLDWVVRVAAVGATPYAASLTSSSFPSLTAGQTGEAVLTFLNTGSATWSPGSVTLIVTEGAAVATSPTTALSSSTAPLASATFRVPLRAPSSPGLYEVRLRLKQGGEEFGPTASTQLSVGGSGGSGDSAEVLSINVPSEMGCNDAWAASVTVRNNGGTTWSSTSEYLLGAPVYPDPLLSPARGARLQLPSSVAPGQVVTFYFAIRAPSTEGVYRTQYQMVHERVAWFGAIAFKDVTVRCSGNPPPCGNLAPPQDADCPLEPPAHNGAVYDAVAELEAERPDIFDFSVNRGGIYYRVVKVDDYLNGIVQNLREQGLCAIVDVNTGHMDEIGVKPNDEYNEQYDVLTGDAFVRTFHTATCSPAWY
jgi:hypothetical protein